MRKKGIKMFEEELSEKLSEDVEGGLLECIKTVIDKICEVTGNEIVSKLPIANFALAVIHTIEGVHNKNLVKQTFAFLENFNNQQISTEKLQKYRKRFLYNDKKQKEELERVLLYLERNIEVEKSKLLTNFFVSYINEEINWDRFCEFATVIDRMYVSDLKTLYEIYKGNENKDVTVVTYESHQIGRLISNGLLSNYSGAITVQEMSGKQSGVRRIYEKNPFGEKFVKIAKRNEELLLNK